jgi:xylulokinase
MLCNQQIGAHFSNIDLNKHSAGHMYRAVHEGIAFSFRYGLDIMRDNAIKTTKVKAGKANMFLSKTFTQAFVNSTGLCLELYKTDGSVGAALGAGIGAGIYKEPKEAFAKLELLETVYPDDTRSQYEQAYIRWKAELDLHLAK